MQNKTLIAVMLVGMAIGMTSCNNGNSTSISNKPSDSTSASSSSKPSISVIPSTSNSTINKVYVESVELNSNITKFLNNKSSSSNKFMDKTKNMIVGDDNNFKFKPIVKFVDENDLPVEVNNITFDIELYENKNDVYEKVVDASTYFDSLDNVNCEVNFNDAAVGKKFKIAVAPSGIEKSKASKFTKEFEIEVSDGFNVYNPKEFAYFNKDRDYNSEYEESTGISVIKAWEDFKVANKLTDTNEKNAFILQCDIEITDNDLPKEFFYHEGDKDYKAQLEGTLRDYSNIYYHTFSNNDEKLGLYGNYFTLNASKISLVKQELDYDGSVTNVNQVISHSTLFRTEKKDGVTGESFVMRDLNLIGNSQRKEDLALGGGIILHKNHSVKALAENNVSNSWFITYFTEYIDSDYVINKCYARDNFNSFIYNYGGNVTIKNSDMEGTGGPIIIQDHVFYSSGATENIAHAVIENSRLENWVSGEEGWFQLVDATALVPRVKALSSLFAQYGRSFVKTRKINNEDVQFFNFICVNKNSRNLMGACEGSIKIDNSAIFDFGKSTPEAFGAFYSTIKKASNEAPIFQSSTGGFAYSNGTQLLDYPNNIIPTTNTSDPIFSGDYLALYYYGLMLTLGYYPVA